MATPNVMSTQSSPVVPRSHVGFDSITNQIERKLLKRGFQFNVICVGGCLVDVISLHWLILYVRSNWLGQIDSNKYDLCISPDRFERPPDSR